VREIFLDAAYLVALLRARDALHGQALTLSRSLAREGARYVTTALVFAETLALVARAGEALRRDGVSLVRDLSADDACTVVDCSSALIEAALTLYEARGDKTYSLTDCASMVICRERGITDVATADRDFVQEGSTALLLVK
jgi:predicted nucleic acid-binding protein